MKTKLLFSFLFFSCFASAQYTKLLDFAGTVNGNNPAGSLIFDGTFLYGMTWGGGTNSSGTIFKIKPDGTGFTKLLDFDGTTNGSHPNGSLITDGTFLYGMTYQGGTKGSGTLFKIKPDGTGYAKLLDFANDTIHGFNPNGSLFYDGTYLYGTTTKGGAGYLCGPYGCGVLFKIKPDGTGYSKLIDFTGSYGFPPQGSLISDGTYLYGTTAGGGSGSPTAGVIFRVKPDGTGYGKLVDFNGPNGAGPQGSLISDGTFLYGMTQGGGTGACTNPQGCGEVFKIKADGSWDTTLLNFTGTANGRYPTGDLISDGTFLYGMTWSGGSNDSGVIFKIKPDGSGFEKLFDFGGGTNGSYPKRSLVSDGTFLYGMTYFGGSYNKGVLFKYGIVTGMAENKEENDFIISPNPTGGVFKLHMNNEQLSTNNYELTIYNVYGEKIYSSAININKTEIDLSKQPNGIYFLHIKTAERIFTRKIVLQR